MDPGPAGLDICQAQRDGQCDLDLLAAAVGLVGPVASRDGVYPDLQTVDDLLRGLLLPLGADVHSHTPAGHGGQDVVALPHDFRDDAPDNHVGDAVDAERLPQDGVVIQDRCRLLDRHPQLRHLSLGLGDALQLRLDGPPLGGVVGDGLPLGVDERPQGSGPASEGSGDAPSELMGLQFGLLFFRP